jgi:hypothetical protein
MMLLDSFFVRYALWSMAELLQAGHAAVAGVAEKLQRTAKIKRSRIVPHMSPKLPRHFTETNISI